MVMINGGRREEEIVGGWWEKLRASALEYRMDLPPHFFEDTMVSTSSACTSLIAPRPFLPPRNRPSRNGRLHDSSHEGLILPERCD